MVASFHARRICRLLPVIGVLLIIGWLCGIEEYRETWAWHVTFLTNFYLVAHNEWIGGLSHFWSLLCRSNFISFGQLFYSCHVESFLTP